MGKDYTKQYMKHLECTIDRSTYIEFIVDILNKCKKRSSWELKQAQIAYNKKDRDGFHSHLECSNMLRTHIGSLAEKVLDINGHNFDGLK